ncbi:MAG TPA: peptidylprolyl isomerase [Ignavibacteriaceae bacterium]|nr:peptidylprolyl isomerase [Ignavibacteriaceae bacterium]
MNLLFITIKLIKLSPKLIKTISFLTAAAFLFGCGKDESKTEYVAKVNDSYLTPRELAEITDTMNTSSFYKNEIVRNWINRELLYQEAIRQGLLEQEKYARILNNSKKELAASLLISKFFDMTQINYDDRDLEDYFNSNSDDFRLLHNGCLINEISFINEENAVKFRNIAVEKNWNYALSEFEKDSSVVYQKTGKFVYEFEINPSNLVRILKELNPGEISVIINESDSSFYIVQLLGSYFEGTIPPFDIIKEEVEKRYVAKKREEALNQYIKELYANNEIKVRN